VEEFCLGIVRRAVLDHQTQNSLAITKQKLDEWRTRLKPKALKNEVAANGQGARNA
jgi:hypothetical protein